ncbi:heparinase II/III-family protein [Horticoccus luteus]|uniref:Heparinase II/III-family protein n=1 Tax=Horticoccus luteus TaxID=2862869 RepID=A0A8F9TW80_9BACT|nr:heparinase II/III family protein [Horticoccus luteus]QYM80236.1 heparinase II/III-family protein [Horticoccus luteus]
MRVTPINSAEAVFEAFFDEQLSELSRWTADVPGVSGFKLTQSWAFVIVNWERPAADGLVLRLHRRFAPELDCTAYDRLLVAINLPEDSVITLAAETDAGPRRRVGTPCGATRHEEWLALDGARRIHALTVEVRSPRAAAGSAWLLWFGLQHTERLTFHLAQWEGYDETWEKYLQPAEFEPTFQPAYGLLIDAEELDAVRREFADSAVTRELRAVGEIARAVQPESMIAETMNFWNYNGFRRERQMGWMLTWHGAFAAQASVMWRDKDLGRRAARFALSMAHCTYWEDSFFAQLRGSTWEQRGFVQATATWDCAVILDLCGEWFTPLGRELILRRIATEAHGAMSQASWWWEYMYHTNQIAWITPARLYGLLVLEQTMPARGEGFPKPAASRVAPHTDIAWANLQENLEHALLPDGGYVEGSTYFTWVARQAVVSALLYGRGRGRNARELVPPALLRTERLAEMLLSTDDGQDMLLTGDAMFAFGEALTFLAWLMPRSHWVTIYRKSRRRSGVAPLLMALRLDREIPAEGPELAPFLEMKDTGMMASVRRLEGELVKLFILGNKAGGDHQHEDKGSFVLECAGDSFAFDFGVMDYANPVTELMKQAQRHNMLTPWSEDVRPKPANPISADVKPQGGGDATAFHATIDATPGWEEWFTKWQRTWDSPTPDELVITDEWTVAKGEGVVFHWTTRLPMALDGRRVTIEGRRAVAELTLPDDVEAVVEELPLLDPRRQATDDQRREMQQFGWQHARTQPRLTVRQRGRSGVLRIAVKLRLRAVT